MGKRIYKINENIFKTKTPEMYYWLGFLIADGCIYSSVRNKMISLCLHNKDANHTAKFRRFCQSTHKIRFEKNRSINHFDFSSKIIYNDLITLGMEERKTYLEKSFISYVPDKFKTPWICGLFDGDGTIFTRKKKVKWKDKSYIYDSNTTRILSNYNTMIDISKYLNDNYNFNYLKVKSHRMLYSITWCSKNDLAEFAKMYKESPVHLERKYYKVCKI